MKIGEWRKESMQTIKRVLAQHPDVDRITLRRLLRRAYPFAPRPYQPYKIWLDEVKKTMLRVFPERLDPGWWEGSPLFPKKRDDQARRKTM